MSTIDITATVRHCLAEYNRVLELESAKGPLTYDGVERCHQAIYRNLPWLIDRDHIRAYIACVTQAMVFRIFSNSTITRLLYAAQVALSALPPEPKPTAKQTTVSQTNASQTSISQSN